MFLSLAALALATTPVFFETYRTAAFNTIPHDDYAPYLLALVGHGGSIPMPPLAYRILSVAVAIPFYHVLPLYTFTNLPSIDPAYLKSMEALAFASYLWLLLTSGVIYLLARRRRGASHVSALVAAMTSFLLSGFLQRTGVDPIAILVIALMLLALENPVAFGVLAVVSIGINEKIPLLFAAVLACRFAGARVQRKAFALGAQFALAGFSVVGYFVVRVLVKVPGNEAQTDPALFLGHLRATLAYSLSLKGLFLNLVPAVVVTMLALVALRTRRASAFQVTDVSGLLVLVLLAGLADVIYNVGRVAMYGYPLYLPAAAALIDELRERRTAAPRSRAARWRRHHRSLGRASAAS